MRKAVLSAVVLAILAGLVPAAAAQAAAPAPATGRKKRVAVFDFDYATVHAGIAALFGQDVDVGKGISDLLVTDLVKDGSYSVIERKALDKILKEQNFSNSDRADPNSAAKIGKLLGVDAIIVGSITQFGNETKNTGVGGGGGGLGGFGLGGFSHKKSKAIVAVTARMVDIDTAEILGVAEGKGESSRESTSLLGGGGNWHGFGGGAADFGSSDFQSTIIGEAVKASVDSLSKEVIAEQRQTGGPHHRCGRPGGSGRQRADRSQCRRQERGQGRRSAQRGARDQGDQRSFHGKSDSPPGIASGSGKSD